MDKQECIERQLESALLEGRWGVFERLPSERGLAEAFGVNRATVRAALRALAAMTVRRNQGWFSISVMKRWPTMPVPPMIPTVAPRGTVKEILSSSLSPPP